jgi:hypothetical protein
VLREDEYDIKANPTGNYTSSKVYAYDTPDIAHEGFKFRLIIYKRKKWILLQGHQRLSYQRFSRNF